MSFLAEPLCPHSWLILYLWILLIPINPGVSIRFEASRNSEQIIQLDTRLRNLTWKSIGRYAIMEAISILLHGEQKCRASSCR